MEKRIVDSGRQVVYCRPAVPFPGPEMGCRICGSEDWWRICGSKDWWRILVPETL